MAGKFPNNVCLPRPELITAMVKVPSTDKLSARGSPFGPLVSAETPYCPCDALIQNIIGIPSETARLCAACINEMIRTDSESKARPRINRDMLGTAMDVMITSSASTKINSIKVKAHRRKPFCPVARVIFGSPPPRRSRKFPGE